MKFYRFITILLTAATLSGCATAMFWHGNNPNESKEVQQTVAKDKIYSFAVVNKNNSQLPEGSLVMIGEKYWFVINPNDSSQLINILNIKLDKPFQITEMAPPSENTHNKALPVILTSLDSPDFKSSLCLRYDSSNEEEITKLKKLEFEANDINNKNAYTRCVNASGKYYSTPQKIVSDYQFKQPIPVNIYYITTKKGLNVAKVAGNILLTPFTLAFDAAGGIFLLPIYFNMENWN